MNNISLNPDFSISKTELSIVYQPQFNIETNEIVGLEALFRATSISNIESFIATLESNKVVHLLDYYMIEETFKLVKTMETQWHRVIPISVNVSKTTLLRKDFHRKLESLLIKYNITTKYIDLELTERELIDDLELLNIAIKKVRKLGIQISIDDFGVGFSTLLAISQLDFDTLKIDKAFICKIGDNGKVDSILHGIKNIMDKNNIITIAEGVELKSQQKALLNCGYKYAQGYLFSKPKPISYIAKSINTVS